MKQMKNNENFQVLLRAIATGDTTVIETPKGEYIAIQCKGFSDIPKGSVERTIESRLQYEIYGEYPLDKKQKLDWEQIVKRAFYFDKH